MAIDDDNTIVEVKQGKLRGKNIRGIRNGTYYGFLGIPYAKAPINDRRFKAPQEPEPWIGIRDAFREGNRSISRQDGKIIGNEDCLFLNVYVKEFVETKRYPVMVWIHGGGFYSGSGNSDLYSPDYLINEDVIVVTLNYRLGLLGMIQFFDPSIGVPGNAGMKDIVMALRWIQENIEAFNGDPSNVTIFGESSGAIAVHSLVVSPMAKGLFHKAICQSGTAFNGHGEKSYPHGPFEFSEALGCYSRNEHEIYELMLRLPAEELYEAFEHVLKNSQNRFDSSIGIVIERKSSEPSFYSQEPEYYYMNDSINKVPLMIGSNALDGMVYASKEYGDKFITPNILDPELLIPRELKIPLRSEKSIELSKKIIEFYYGQETPSRRNIEKFCKYQTDVKYNLRTKRAVQFHQSVNAGPIYLYKFAFESPINLFKKIFGLTIPGVCHGDELTYLFHTKYTQKIKIGSNEEKTVYRMVKLWTNFAKHSNPNPVEHDPLINIEWKPVQPGKLNHLNIGKILSYREEQPDNERMSFWDKLFVDLNNYK